MAGGMYVNKAVRAMYGIPLSQLTPKQRKILREDGERRAKLIEDREKAVRRDNLKAFQDEAQFERVLQKAYEESQKAIIADVTKTFAKVQEAGGVWSYANQSALTRSRGLFDQINDEIMKLGGKESTLFNQFLTKEYTEQFTRALFTLGQTISLKGEGAFAMLNPRLVQATLNYPWSGAMFSDRLWLDKERLTKNLRWGLTQSMILGEGIPQITKRINNNINTSRYNAERVARTEVKRVSYTSQADAWKTQNIQEVKYMTAGNGTESNICAVCWDDHGKMYILGEEPSLPRHPNCRCWYVPHVPDTYKPGELNELTNSVRGAENYEKWMDANRDKLNPDGTLKDGWVRDWKNGGKLVYKGDPQTAASVQDRAKALIQADRDKEINLRAGLNAKIDTLNEEYKAVPSQYADRIAEKEKLKADYIAKAQNIENETVELYNRKDGIRDKRMSLMDDYENGKMSDDVFDKRSELLREERRTLRDLISEKESQSVSYRFDADKIDLEIKSIREEIRKKQADISAEIHKINIQITESIQREAEFDLDLKFIGNNEEHLKDLSLFREIRTAMKNNPTFDYDLYKDEMVQMAQRMDHDALVIHSKLSKITEKNLYDYTQGGAAYWPTERRVKMSMKNNSHEKALGNGLKGSWQTKYHEEGHQIDHLLDKVDQFSEVKDPSKVSFAYIRDFTNGGTVSGIKISQAIEQDISDFLNEAISYSNANEGTAYKPFKSFSRISRDARFAFGRYVNHLTSNMTDQKANAQLGILSDAVGLFTEDRISPYNLGMWGHRSSYNKDRGKNGANSETWATFCALRTCGSPEEVQVAQKVMPTTWKVMNGIFHELAVYLENGGEFKY